jgi:hypothetical protein
VLLHGIVISISSQHIPFNHSAFFLPLHEITIFSLCLGKEALSFHDGTTTHGGVFGAFALLLCSLFDLTLCQRSNGRCKVQAETKDWFAKASFIGHQNG